MAARRVHDDAADVELPCDAHGRHDVVRAVRVEVHGQLPADYRQQRLEQRIQEAVVTVPRALIAETIDVIAVLSGRGSARRLTELAQVTGLGADGDYDLSPAIKHPEPSGASS